MAQFCSDDFAGEKNVRRRISSHSDDEDFEEDIESEEYFDDDTEDLDQKKPIKGRRGRREDSSDEEFDVEEDELESDNEGTYRRSSSRRGETRIANNPSSSPFEHDGRWMTKNVTFRFSASLQDLAESKRKPYCTISENAKAMFKDPNEELKSDADKRKKSSKRSVRNNSDSNGTSKSNANHIVGEIKLIEYRNNFPCSLKMRMSGIKTSESKSFTSDDSICDYVLLPKTDRFGYPITLVERSASVDTPFLEKFPGYTLDNIEQGITNFDDSRTLVPVNHPIVATINQVRLDQGKDELNPDDAKHSPVVGFYVVERTTVDSFMGSLKADMENFLPLTNLYKLSPTFSRAFTGDSTESSTDHLSLATSWTNGTEIFENLASDSPHREKILKTIYDTIFTLSITYRNA